MFLIFNYLWYTDKKKKGEDMKKSIRIVEIFIILFIIIIIGIVAGFIVSSVIKNMEFDKNKILVDNFANEILYAKELYMKKELFVPGRLCLFGDWPGHWVVK